MTTEEMKTRSPYLRERDQQIITNSKMLNYDEVKRFTHWDDEIIEIGLRRRRENWSEGK